jgi:hypothetical protein
LWAAIANENMPKTVQTVIAHASMKRRCFIVCLLNKNAWFAVESFIALCLVIAWVRLICSQDHAALGGGEKRSLSADSQHRGISPTSYPISGGNNALYADGR